MKNGGMVWLKEYYLRIELSQDDMFLANMFSIDIDKFSEKLTTEEATFRKLADNL